MSTFNLDRLLAPRSVALVGASARPGALGQAVLHNLRRGGFSGRLFPVNPRYGEIAGTPCFASLEALPEVPDLVVVGTPANAVPQVIASAAGLGVRAAVVLTAGLGHGAGSLAATVHATARARGLRLVGPNCLGIMAPGAGFDASFAASPAPPGELALVSQSGAVAAAMVERAQALGFGFSAVLSLGDMLDVDFADALDLLAAHTPTRAILLYIEAIAGHGGAAARKFMSAARAAARTKPVIVLKVGRHVAAAKAAATHTGALAGADDVYDAAFRRAGLVRVLDLNEMIAAARMLARHHSVAGHRLTILTNGGGLGVLAVDRLLDLGGQLAVPAPETLARLDRVLPETWSRANPVDIIGDADATRYAAALEIVLDDPGCDAVLVMNVPTALALPADAAKAVAGVARARPRKTVLATWLGDSPPADRALAEAGVARFGTETEAVQGFMHLARHRQGQELLTRTPPALPDATLPDLASAQRIVQHAVAEGREWLDPLEVLGVMQAYHIPTPPLWLATSGGAAVAAAASTLAHGGTVALKIHAHGIIHKSDVGGVVLDLASAGAVAKAFDGIMARAAERRPDAKILGVTVQPMIRRRDARELLAGMAIDPTFGPVLVFGAGGTNVEIVADRAIELPPLDLLRAGDMIARTRVSKLLAAWRNVPAADRDAVALVLVQLGRMAADLPQVRSLDINPLLADADGVLALDARVALATGAAALARPGANFAIRPYPREWERRLTTRGGLEVLLRPIRPEDEALYPAFVARVSADDLHARFMGSIALDDHAFLARLTQLDYARAMAFAAISPADGALLGVMRLHSDGEGKVAEFALLVRTDLKGQGLGYTLMQHGLDWARAEGLARVAGSVLANNAAMLRLCHDLGFRRVPSDEPTVAEIALDLAG
jgi:acetyltransferase